MALSTGSPRVPKRDAQIRQEARFSEEARWYQRIRYRLGARLLRPHIITMLEHYNALGSAPSQGESIMVEARSDPARRERGQYIGIGLRYALGVGTRWHR